MALGFVAFNFVTFLRDMPLHEGPILWFLWLWAAIMSAVILVFGVIQPRRWRGRLEVRNLDLFLHPNPFMHQFGEPTSTVRIGPETSEILICRGSQDTYPWSLSNRGNYPMGFRVLVRSSDGRDRELKVETGERLSPRQARILSEGITSATRLPVRFVRREGEANAEKKEIPWTPASRFALRT